VTSETTRVAELLKVNGLSKSFGETLVLDNVSFAVASNSIVGIVGENGAGKSTLFNIISGIVRPDKGRIEFRGKEIKLANYREANVLGISRVFQEQALIPNVAVYENILLSHEARFSRLGQLLDKRCMIKAAQRITDGMKLDIDVRRQTSDYDFSKRQSIEIARACLVPRDILSVPTTLVLMDEPTSALEKSEEDALFDLIRNVKQHGSVLFVSHRLSEVLNVCDLIHVLKDGRLVATVRPEEVDERILHGLMVGRERDTDYYHEEDQGQISDRPIALKVRNLTSSGSYENVSFEVHRGEVFGVGGLLDSGKSHLGKGIVGLARPDAGTVSFGEELAAPPNFYHLASNGVAYVPSERLAEGIIPLFSIAWNVSLAGGRDLFANKLGIWRSAVEDNVTRRYLTELDIKAPSPRSPCATLSGGNQQKVVLAKWLCLAPRLIVLDNPTRGIDAGAKEEIYLLIRRLTKGGASIVLITDELLELIGLSHRIGIMRGGRLSEILDAPPERKPSERELVSHMLGV
jgi:ribose transport system ATP-binding protein